MKTLIIYDSVFGNTEKVAQAMGKALDFKHRVEVVKVGDATIGQLSGIELLIVGSPTRAFRPTPAMSKFLGGIPPKSLKGVRVAAFDTRASVDEIKSRLLHAMVGMFGYAADPMAKKLVNKGAIQTAEPVGFFVKESEGPLKDGELERAAEWAKSIGEGRETR